MPIVTLQLPDVKRKSKVRPKNCPYCQGETFQSWGSVQKSVKDKHHRTVLVNRYKCCHCRRTFRHYPEGVDRATQTQRLRKLAALSWRDRGLLLEAALLLGVAASALRVVPLGRLALEALSNWLGPAGRARMEPERWASRDDSVAVFPIRDDLTVTVATTLP